MNARVHTTFEKSLSGEFGAGSDPFHDEVTTAIREITETPRFLSQKVFMNQSL
jgi:hypothetical protein